MHKIIVAITSCVLFQSTLFAENYQAADNAAPGKTDSTVITPEVGSQYNLEGMQTGAGQYKSSYSTNTLEKRKQVSDSSLQPAGGNSGLNIGVNPVPVIIVIDEQD
jgi:hypothetical protein